MIRNQRNLRAIQLHLRTMEARKELDPETVEAVQRALRKLVHSVRVRRLDKVEQAINEIALSLLKVTE